MKRKRQLHELISIFSHRQQELVKNADKHKEEVVSQSLETLREVLADPYEHPYRNYVSDALVLLSHFEEAKAHPYLLQIIRQPDSLVEALIGEALPLYLPAYLYKTCGNSMKEMQQLVADKSVYIYCRVAGMQAIVFGAQDGVLPKKEALDFLATLFTGKEAASPDTSFWDEAVQAICKIGPENHLALIKNAIQRGLTDLSFVDERYLAQLQ